MFRQVIDWAAWLASSLVRPIRSAGSPVMRFARLVRARSLCEGRIPVSVQFDGPVRVGGRPHVVFGPACRLGRDVYLETNGMARIELGSHVRLNAGCLVVAYASITIGDNCLIGEYVSLRDANHGTAPGAAMRSQPHTAEPISIGNDVWIGRGCAILKGVQIGHGAVVGANSTVTRSIPPMAIVAGSPARIVRMRGEL